MERDTALQHLTAELEEERTHTGILEKDCADLRDTIADKDDQIAELEELVQPSP